jgi:hypothetical protein
MTDPHSSTPDAAGDANESPRLPIAAAVQPRQIFWNVIYTVLCGGLALWGAWDYFVTIPEREADHARFVEAKETVEDLAAASTLSPSRLMEARVASQLIKGESGTARDIVGATRGLAAATDDAGMTRQRLERDGFDLGALDDLAGTVDISDFTEKLIEFSKGMNDESRLLLAEQLGGKAGEMLLASAGVRREGDISSVIDQAVRVRLSSAASSGLTSEETEAYLAAEAITKEFAEPPVPPAAYDRAVQLWLYMVGCGVLGTPFFVWNLIVLPRTAAKWRLDEDGSLSTPEGRLAPDEISELDMNRWMAKSIATVVTADGRRIALDDYKFRNMDRIIGALAQRFEPDKWTLEAKAIPQPEVVADAPPKEGEESAEESAPEPDADESRPT